MNAVLRVEPKAECAIIDIVRSPKATVHFAARTGAHWLAVELTLGRLNINRNDSAALAILLHERGAFDHLIQIELSQGGSVLTWAEAEWLARALKAFEVEMTAEDNRPDERQFAASKPLGLTT